MLKVKFKVGNNFKTEIKPCNEVKEMDDDKINQEIEKHLFRQINNMLEYIQSKSTIKSRRILKTFNKMKKRNASCFQAFNSSSTLKNTIETKSGVLSNITTSISRRC